MDRGSNAALVLAAFLALAAAFLSFRAAMSWRAVSAAERVYRPSGDSSPYELGIVKSGYARLLEMLGATALEGEISAIESSASTEELVARTQELVRTTERMNRRTQRIALGTTLVIWTSLLIAYRRRGGLGDPDRAAQGTTTWELWGRRLGIGLACWALLQLFFEMLAPVIGGGSPSLTGATLHLMILGAGLHFWLPTNAPRQRPA